MGHRHQIIHKLNKQFLQRAVWNASAGSVELKMKAADGVFPRLQMNAMLPPWEPYAGNPSLAAGSGIHLL